MKHSIICLALLATTGLPSLNATGQVPSPDPAPVSVVTIGASLAAGTSSFIASVNDDSEAFDDIHQYHDVLAALEPTWKIETFADMMFFSKPIERGEEFVVKALAQPSQVILALDYLFWFGYGDHYDDSGEKDATRLAFLTKEGFPRLERLWSGLPEEATKPLVLIGTMPDVRDSTVIGASQKPSDEELLGLNAAIVAWANQHPNVLIVPFAERLAKVRQENGAQVGTQTYTEKDLPKLMLSDRLHPSTQGSALIAALCLETLHGAKDGAKFVQADPKLLDPRAIANQLIAARKAAAAKPVPAGAGR